jgi:hypothetical protein
MPPYVIAPDELAQVSAAICAYADRADP